MMNSIQSYIDIKASVKCYAVAWSYGEICVHCGCCSTDPLERAKARLEYHRQLLYERQNFAYWDYEDPGIFALQKRNVEEDIRLHTKMIEIIEEEVSRLIEEKSDEN